MSRSGRYGVPVACLGQGARCHWERLCAAGVGYAWDGGWPAGAVSGLVEDGFRSSGETLWDASGVAQDGV